MAVSTVSYTKTPQAGDDTYTYTENELQTSSNYDVTNSILTLDVMANDLGGNAKKLYSIDNGDALTDLLTKDPNLTTAWSDQTELGNSMRINGGKIEVNLSASLAQHGGSLNALAEGEHITDSFKYAIQLGNGTISYATVTIDIVGSNDGPVAYADADSGDEDTIISGSVATNDVDLDNGAVLAYALVDPDNAPEGLTFNPDGSYELNASNYDYLAEDEPLELQVEYSVTDEWGATSTSTLTITINGVNDAPVITSEAQSGAVDEDTLLTASGQVTSDDVDNGATASYSGDASGAYGSFTVNAVTGEWLYTLDNEAHQDLAAGESFEEIFSVTVTDDEGATATQDVTITVTGTNDAPEISGSATGAVSEDPQLLGAPTVFPTDGSFPYGFTVADVNEDGNADVVVANLGSHSVAVLLGDGDGGFGAPDLNPMGFQIDYTSVGDVDGDGHLDIVTANGLSAGGSVSVLLGDGMGAFDAPVTYGTSLGYTHIANLADMDGDSDLDIVASGDGGVSVLINDGAGAYTPGATYDIDGGTYTISSALADVDGDGDTDVIATLYGFNQVAVQLNNGSGALGAPTLYSTSADYPVFVVAADLNGDGAVDIVTANGLTDDMSVLLNDGSGGFGPAATYGVGADFPAYFAVDDVNGDGFVDIVAPTVLGSTDVSVLLGDGTGAFAAPSLIDVGGDHVVHAALADVNGDGLLDVLTTNSLSGSLSVLLNTTPTISGTLTASDVDNGDSQTWSIEGGATGSYGSLALNGNTGEWIYTLDNASLAVQSLAAGESHDETFTVLVTDSQGAHDEQLVTVTVTGTNDAPVITSEAQSGAVDEDTLLTASGQVTSDDVDNGATASYSGDASGAYGSFTVNAVTGEWLYTLDNEAHQDLAAGESFEEIFSVTVTDDEGATATQDVTITVTGTNDAPEISGSATGAVSEDPQLLGAPTVFPTDGSFPYGFTVADVNEDGNADVVVANLGSHSVAVLLGDGDGGFGAPDLNPMGFQIDYTSVGDVDGDGHLDIVTANGLSAGGSVSVLLGDGMGAFDAPVTYGTSLGYTHIANLADMDGDSDLDIVASGDGGVSVLINDGAGAYTPGATYDIDGGTYTISSALADVDGDGDTDVIATLYGFNQVAVQLNNGSGALGAPTLYSTSADYPVFVVAADLNGDGAVDIVTANGLTDDMSVLLNDGSGGFGPAATYGVGADFPAYFAVDDVNGDGFVDIVAPTVLGSTDVSVLLGDGTGAFAAPSLIDVGGDHVVHAALADVNGDGLLDVLTTNSLSGSLSVLLNTTPTISGTLTASDVDNGDSQTWSIEGGATGSYGSLALNGNTGEWIYTLDNASLAVQSLAAGESHDEIFTVRVTDSQGGFDEQLVTVTVAGTNDAPELTSTQATLADGTEDIAYVVSEADLLAGFSDVEGDTLSVANLSSSDGTVTDNGDGTYTITPTADFNGAVTLSYDVVDGNGGVLAANLGYSLAAVEDNTPPSLSLSVPSYSIDENTSTASAIKVADITVTDDGIGTNNLSLSGADAGYFEIVGTELFLKAGVTLDFENKTSYAVAVNVDDASVGASPDGSQSFTLSLTDVFESEPNNYDTLTIVGGANDTVGANSFTDSPPPTADLYNGLGGNDTISSGGLNDQITGGSGTDSISGGNNNDILFGGSENDTIDGGNNDDTIYGGTGDDSLSGSDNNDTIFGGTGADILLGGNGDDSLTGGVDIDQISGQGGNDLIRGSDANDTISGGSGSDTMWGDGGADVFKWALADVGSAATPAADVIKDFVAGETLDLTDLLDPGNMANLSVTQDANGTTISLNNGTDVGQTIYLEFFTADTAANILAELQTSQTYTL